MMEHNCRNLGGFHTRVKKENGSWHFIPMDDYYSEEIHYCPFCGIKLEDL